MFTIDFEWLIIYCLYFIAVTWAFSATYDLGLKRGKENTIYTIRKQIRRTNEGGPIVIDISKPIWKSLTL